MTSQTANVPTALTLNTFTRAGYSFSGWNTQADGLGTNYADGATYAFAADITLYAKWTALPNHTVTFNSQRRHGHDESQTANVPTALTLNTFTRAGYSFSGWNTQADGWARTMPTAPPTTSVGGHHALRQVDGAAEAHGDLQRQRWDGHDAAAGRQRPHGIDAQHLHAGGLLVQRLEHAG